MGGCEGERVRGMKGKKGGGWWGVGGGPAVLVGEQRRRRVLILEAGCSGGYMGGRAGGGGRLWEIREMPCDVCWKEPFLLCSAPQSRGRVRL